LKAKVPGLWPGHLDSGLGPFGSQWVFLSCSAAHALLPGPLQRGRV